MRIAIAVAERARDTTDVGAVIVQDDLIVATGFNGFPRGIPAAAEEMQVKAAAFGLDQEATFSKNAWMVHAEENAIINAARSGVKTDGATMYVTRKPCFNCQKAIIQAGIKTVWVNSMAPWRNEWVGNIDEVSEYLSKKAGLQVTQVPYPLPTDDDTDVPESGDKIPSVRPKASA